MVILGGHGKGTAIRPLGAIDTLYVLAPRLRRSDAATVGGRIAATLGESFGVVRVDRDGWFTVRGPGQPARPWVRVVPGFAEADGAYRIAGPAGTWRSLNPSAEAARLRRLDAACGGKATHLVLLLKAWRRARTVPLAPLALELLACEFVSAQAERWRGLTFYDWTVRDLFQWLGGQAGRHMALPGCDDALAVGEAWIEAAAEAHQSAAEACRLERDQGDAVEAWRRVFGPAFGEAAGVPARLPAPPEMRPAAAV